MIVRTSKALHSKKKKESLADSLMRCSTNSPSSGLENVAREVLKPNPVQQARQERLHPGALLSIFGLSWADM